MNIKQALVNASVKLEENKIQTPQREAKYLMKFLLKKDDMFFITNLKTELSKEEEENYFKLIDKRCTHMPFSYITGKKEFMGLEFLVDESTLIPRPETEIIVEYVIQNFKNKNLNILEIGTGSGCISISIAKYLKKTTFLAVDISKKALDMARKNAKIHNVENRIEFIQSDIYKNVHDKFDIIISNPPYIKNDVIETLSDDVKKYEPITALAGGDDGLYFYNKIIKDANSYLKEHGDIIFEIGYDQGNEVKEILEKYHFKNINIIKDLAGFDRTVTAQK